MREDNLLVRTAADLERKYNFNSMKKAIETSQNMITKVENENNNIINSIILNLGDILDNQTDISLWFYNGIPTTSNEPYINWDNAEEHIGDLYYDKDTGLGYKFNGTEFENITDPNLLISLGLTNAEVDTTNDKERKVYFNEPIPPYSNGDWWVLEDGTLKICQISKNEGELEKDDFIVSTKYINSVAVKQGNKLTVLDGTVTQLPGEISEQTTELISSRINEIRTTMLEQTDERISFWYNTSGTKQLVDDLDELCSNNQTTLNTISEYIHFEGAKITLGKSTSACKVVITNEKISFMVGDSECAYISNNQLYINEIVVMNKLQQGQFLDIVDSQGNLNKIWVGE